MKNPHAVRELTVSESDDFARRYPYDGEAVQCHQPARTAGRTYVCTRPMTPAILAALRAELDAIAARRIDADPDDMITIISAEGTARGVLRGNTIHVLTDFNDPPANSDQEPDDITGKR